MASTITSRHYSKPHRPIPVRIFNTLSGAAKQMGISQFHLEAGKYLDKAAQKTGLNYFGDPLFLVRLEHLLDSMSKEARLHNFGMFMVSQNIIRLLINRLRIESIIKINPEILGQEMEDPVFITGLQRTGTTMLQRLLSCDPDLRSLSSWEAINPAPFPAGKVKQDGQDPRIRQAMLGARALKYLSPDFFAIHPIDPLGPEEDCMLFDYDFFGTVPEATYRVPSFSSYLEKLNHIKAYEYYKKILFLLMWQKNSGRWIMKSPQHLEQLEALFTVFPNAKVIQTHRDPLKVVPSLLSMISHAWGVFSDDVNPNEAGRHWERKQHRMIHRAMDYRNKTANKNFIDISYYELTKDPIREIEKIYKFLNLNLTGEKIAAMRSWINSNPADKYGKHQYNINDFGFTESEIEERFSLYRNFYNIPNEHELSK